MIFFKKIWYYSKLRFYFLNAKWNISFWLKCKKVYKNVIYEIKKNDFYMDEALKLHYKKEKKVKKRFVGYMYKGILYYDNPGLQIKDQSLWNKWKKDKLIN